MPRGPPPSVAASPVPDALAKGMETFLEEMEVQRHVSTSSSALNSETWDSDSETDYRYVPSDVLEDEETTTSETETSLCGGDRKRRRLFGAKDTRSCSDAVRRAVAAEATLIILDWDDTLLPSTWLLNEGLQIADGSAPPNEEQKAELSKVAQCVIQTLRKVKRLGHVTLVTNAEKGWVELSCRKFLPEVAPLLEGIKVSSARSAFETAQAQSPVDWKRMAFNKEIGTFLQMPSRIAEIGLQNNIVSVGDSMSERTALMEATEGMDCWAKSLKLLERPSPDQLVKQHDLLCSCLRQFVDHEGSLDLCLEVPG